MSVIASSQAGVVFEEITPYNRVLVLDNAGIRTLSFDGSQETRMSLRDPLQGHFEYTELFHLAWLWNTNLQQVLMIGLGGGSAQRSFLHYYPQITVDSVELDPVVVKVATNFFRVPVSTRHRIHVADGGAYLRRTRQQYDLIVMDAYTTTPAGSRIPPHLLQPAYLRMLHDRLTNEGVLAYNVIGTIQGPESHLVRTLAEALTQVFPQTWCAPARESQNVVLFACRDAHLTKLAELRSRATRLVRDQTVALPRFLQHTSALRSLP